jgi:hypothetical protein
MLSLVVSFALLPSLSVIGMCMMGPIHFLLSLLVGAQTRKAHFSVRLQYYCFFLIFIKPLYHAANPIWDIFQNLFAPYFQQFEKIAPLAPLDRFLPQT